MPVVRRPVLLSSAWEDHEDFRDVIVSVAQRLGFDAVVAGTGRTVSEELRRAACAFVGFVDGRGGAGPLNLFSAGVSTAEREFGMTAVGGPPLLMFLLKGRSPSRSGEEDASEIDGNEAFDALASRGGLCVAFESLADLQPKAARALAAIRDGPDEGGGPPATGRFAEAPSLLDDITMIRLVERNAAFWHRDEAAAFAPIEPAMKMPVDEPAGAASAPSAAPPLLRGLENKLGLPFFLGGVAAVAIAFALWRDLGGAATMLVKLLKLGATAPPPAARAEAGEVEVSAFAPEGASRGEAFLVQAFAHLWTEPSRRLAGTAREADPTAVRRGVKTLDIALVSGERLDFVLEGEGVAIDEPLQSLVWRGRSRGVAFLTRILEPFPGGAAQLKLRVFRDAVPLGAIRFSVKVLGASKRYEIEPAGEQATRYRRAFLSYASSDRGEVLKRAQGLRAAGLDFFHDLLSLKPGERWEETVFREIERSDLFLLFWSRAALESEWVMREVNHARATALAKGRPAEILPVILEGPPPPAPPVGLEDLHFNDPLCYVIAASEKLNAARPIA